MPKFVGWDIDGTLLSNLGLGVEPFNRAISEKAHVRSDVGRYRDKGFTDVEIIMEHGVMNSSLQFDILESYAAGLSAVYEAGKRARALKAAGVYRELNLGKNNEFVPVLITGNYLKTAKMKVHSAELPLPGQDRIFTADPTRPKRADVIAFALRALNIEPRDLVIVGDTLRDAEAAADMGLASIIISEETAKYSKHIPDCHFVSSSISGGELKSLIGGVLHGKE